jgi:hypothetical protein
MNSNSRVALACATLTITLSFAAADAVAAKPGSGVDPCAGKQPAFVFNKGQSGSSGRFFFLADASGACQRLLFSVFAGNYDRYASFRMVGNQGRMVTTDGLERMIFVTFTVGSDLAVSDLSVRPLFDQANPGITDNGGFDLSADGRRLVYVTYNEDGLENWLNRVRVLEDVDACLGCAYEEGTLLAERTGINHSLQYAQFSADESTIWLEDRRGEYYRPYLSTIPATTPVTALHEPQIQVQSEALDREIHLLNLRSTGTAELLAYTSRLGPGCAELKVVDTATCSNGTCTQVNSATTAVLTSVKAGSLASADEAGLVFFLEDAKVGKRGQCSATGAIKRVEDTGAAVLSIVVATGVFPTGK